MQDSLLRLSKKQRLRIQTRHKVSVERYGYQPQALYWSSREIQEIRFQKLIEILPSPKTLKHQAWSLLDVGCGFADLVGYLERNNYFPDYTGIDVSPDMVRGAQSMHPQKTILEGELSELGFTDNQFDYVFLSGALNEVVETEIEGTAEFQGNYAKSVIMAMYKICKKGVAFNLLNSQNAWVKSRFDLQSFLPNEIEHFCASFVDEVVLIEGYLENDFTIYLRKLTEE
ncbi:bifunctional 2-polyprenyl-6-hydroxyphenol methylase/3-demethylubiquinol 3-O-methyltransferase UbiG [Thiomicrorhabdus sp. Kp2]|uniref:class I SAM-dependent methyltransferase n=1 Tax=Thiomicrorhabdus sp. Kp2 TaxID=1123518 RepID=UPI0003FA7519|nr:class I SAM-dependent methyltransferase [Thiomicrorhabdus sp. Kp2]